MINKIVASIAEALEGVKDGSTVLVGGFGAVGQPNLLIEGLLEQGAKNLTVVANNAGFSPDIGLPLLFKAGRAAKLICSFPRFSGILEQLHAAGSIELEIVPQGTLAERIRAGGAGIPAFYTPTGVGTPLAVGKETREFQGRPYLLEQAIEADVALVEAWAADRWGNLRYRGSGRNFNPVMATAARNTIAQVHEYSGSDAIAPDAVVTPGVYVNRVYLLPEAARGKLGIEQMEAIR